MTHWLEQLGPTGGLLKGSMLLLATLFICIALRRRSAAVVHRLWFMGFCTALLVPIVPWFVPHWNWRILPEPSTASAKLAASTTSEATHSSGSTTSPVGADALWSAADNPPFPEHLETSSYPHAVPRPNQPAAVVNDQLTPAEQPPSSTSNPSASAARTPPLLALARLSIGDWLCVLWFLGAAMSLLRMLLQYQASERLRRQCEPIVTPQARSICAELARQLGILPPSLLSHPAAPTPFVMGVQHPSLVLPVNADQWSEERLRCVLLHELAHVKRHDLLTHTMSRIALAAYWFHPVAWWGYHQMLRLREIACDDVVLEQGECASGYAETLLQIAKQYRSCDQAFAVGMARRQGLASRIHAALDASRKRGAFSRRASRLATCVAAGLCVLAGAIHFQTQARARPVSTIPETDSPAQQDKTSGSGRQDNAAQDKTAQDGAERGKAETGNEDDKAKEPPQAIDELAREMIVRILDEQSQPLVDADVYVTGVDQGRRGNLPRIHYPTDELGQARIRFRDGTLLLQLWPSKNGYVPQTLRLDEEELGELPAQYTFYMERGSKLSGSVVDESGRPIQGAKVHVRSDGQVKLSSRSESSSPRAYSSSWLANGDGAAITDAQGRWEINNAPSAARNPDLKFELLVDHDQFVGDSRWGDYQTQQGITAERLRDGSASLVMRRGAILRGKISGPDGMPVTKGLVIWVENPYFATGDNEVEIQADGSFELPNLAPGQYPITVLAPGFAPDQRQVEISPGAPTCDFNLAAGNPIRIEIVDASGNAIPNAYVGIGQWRGTDAIYNEKHSNVPDSGIARRADDQGVFTWNWAPNDGVEYQIGARGYDSKIVTLVAKSEPHRVVLTAPLSISGKVVDAKSGKPIPTFQVIPVKAFRPDFYSTDFQKNRVAEGQDGAYEISINTRGSTTDRYRVRIEADGYRTAFGQASLVAGDPPLVEDFQLEPARPLVGTVVAADGSAISDFQVAIGTPTTSPHFDFDRPDKHFGKAFEVHDSSSFEVAASFETQRIRVFTREAFAEIVVPPEQETIGEVVLQPYARLSGRLTQNDAPVAAQGIYFSPLIQYGLTEARFQDSFYAQTDPDGTFEFERLPPIAGSVHAYLGPWRDSPLASSQSIPLQLNPGDHQQVSLGGTGTQLTGRVVASGRSNDDFSKQWSLNWLVSRSKLAAGAPEFRLPSEPGPLQAAWLKHTDFSAWLASKPNHFVKLRDDGYFSVHGVPEGEYDLVIQLFEQPAGCLIEAVGTEVIPITVTAEQAKSKTMGLGTVEVACRSGPRPGSDMRAFEIVDRDGQVVSVYDLSGRYVVFHVWASWCEPCLATLPEIQTLLSEMPDAPITAVGLNVDAQRDQAMALAKKMDLSWAQNYLGENSDLAKQLAVSSVPAYYLIGPDGKLIASAGQWQEIGKLLAERIQPQAILP